jgi:hypothetical protein
MLLLILAPIIGLAANVPVQLLAGRLDPRHRVLRSALVGFAFGGIVCAAVSLVATAPRFSVFGINEIALLAVNFFSYAAFGFCYWIFLNLGAGSIRMRIFDELDRSPAGLSKQDLCAHYDDDALLRARVKRLLDHSLITCQDGRYRVRSRALVALAMVIRTCKYVIMGSTSQFTRRSAAADRSLATSLTKSTTASKFTRRSAAADRSLAPDRLLCAGIFAIHLLALAISASLIFSHQRKVLLHTLDGASECCFIRLQKEWMPLAPAFGNNPLAGMGNVFAFVNTRMKPSFALGSLTADGFPNPVTIYVVCALELFAALLFLGGCLRVSIGWRLLTAWGAVVFSLPYTWPSKFVNLSDHDPHHIEMQALSCVAIGCFFLVGKSSWRQSLASTLGGFVCVFLMAVAQPQWFIVSVPVLGVFGLVFLAFSKSRRELWHKLAATGLLVLLSAPTLAPYLAGSILNSVPVFFGQEMRQTRAGIILTSILFHHDIGRYGHYLWICSFIGAAIDLFSKQSRTRPLAAGTLAGHLTVLAAVGITRVVMQDYQGPPILYMEIYLWPFYFFYGCRLVLWILDYPINRCQTIATNLLSRLKSVRSVHGNRSPAWSLVLLVLPVVFVSRSLSHDVDGFQEWPRPTPSTPITEYLHGRIGLDSGEGSAFRGVAASFLGYHETRRADWHTLVSSDYVKVLREGGNQHRGLGLWEHDIPTLFDYNYLVPPAFYAVTSRTLARRGDAQERNLTIFTKVEPRYLASLGVRFVITDFPVPELRQRLEFQAQPEAKPLYVFEIERPNLGDYSPTEIRVVEDAHSAIEQMQQADFDFRRQAVAFEPLPDGLRPATVRSVSFSRRGVQIEAESAGRSLLMLPLPYSHCLDLQAEPNAPQEAPRLVRINLSQTGLLFSGKLDATIRYGYGPFDHPYGMIADYLELKSLGLDDVPDYRDRAAPARVADLAARKIADEQVIAAVKAVRTFDQVAGRPQQTPERYLVDGDPTTIWHSAHSSQPSVEEINVELDAVERVFRIRWLAASDLEHVAPSALDVDVSVDGRQWQRVDPLSGVEQLGRWRALSISPAPARFIRLRGDSRLLQIDYTMQIAELAIDKLGPSSDAVELTWTAPGDDGLDGSAYEYEVRRSKHPIRNTADWAQAETVPDLPPAPAEAGSKQSMRVALPEGEIHEWHYALVAIDRAQNASPVSNDARFAPTSSAAGAIENVTQLPADSGKKQR